MASLPMETTAPKPVTARFGQSALQCNRVPVLEFVAYQVQLEIPVRCSSTDEGSKFRESELVGSLASTGEAVVKVRGY